MIVALVAIVVGVVGTLMGWLPAEVMKVAGALAVAAALVHLGFEGRRRAIAGGVFIAAMVAFVLYAVLEKA